MSAEQPAHSGGSEAGKAAEEYLSHRRMLRLVIFNIVVALALSAGLVLLLWFVICLMYQQTCHYRLSSLLWGSPERTVGLYATFVDSLPGLSEKTADFQASLRRCSISA